MKELKQNTNIVDIVSRYVSLKKDGIHEIGICPFHNDSHSSLKVTPSKQIFKCFACGESGDVIDFVEKYNNVSTSEAIKIIKNESIAIGKPTPIVLEKPADQWNYTTELPQSEPTFQHYKHGQPSVTHAYHDKKGNVISYVCRFDLPGGSKEVLPYSPITDGSVVKWGWKGLPAPKSLYNLHLIHQNPTAPIVVVEGEKCADHGNKYSEKDIYVAWQGGANGIKHSNFKPLHGRKVLLWPDNDTAGHTAMLNIAESIGKATPLLKWVKIPDDKPNKWDCADQEWTTKELHQFPRVNMSDVPELPSVEPAPVKPKQTHQETDHYRLLGYAKDSESKLAYFFFSFGSKTVVRLTPTSMGKSNLIMLAPINYWEMNFPGAKNGINMDQAQNHLIQLSHKIGPFRGKFIRGRGAWIDEEKLIIHTGENIIVDGKSIPLSEYESKFVYEINEDLHFGYENPLLDNESKYILDSFSFPVWDREVNANLLAGWCVISPFCGVLDWRPHIWVTGPAGSSKSWIMENLVLRLCGEIGVQIQGRSTSSGITGLLQSDARPVIYDEADADGNRDKERIQSILAGARIASSKTGGVEAKGTQTGGARTSDPRSCYALSSIGINLKDRNDKSRFTIMTLKPFEGVKTTREFNDFSTEWFEKITPDFVKKLQARTLSLIPSIKKNALVFASAVTEHVGSRRLGDQVGILLAGAYSLTSSELVTYDDALEFVKSKDWSEEQSMESTRDEIQLLNVITSSNIKVDGNYDRTIGELIMIADCRLVDSSFLIEKAVDTLRRIGIIVKDDKLLISNNSEGVKRAVKDTSWSNDYSKLLKRIDGAENVNGRIWSPGGTKQRGTSIPLSIINDGKSRVMNDNEYLKGIKPDYSN